MVSISARVSEDLERDLEEFMDEEKLDKSVAVRKLLHMGLEDWKLERALDLLEEGKVSFSRAAELADRDVWKFADIVKDRKITWIKGEDLEKDLEAL